MPYVNDDVVDGVYQTSDLDLVAALSMYHEIESMMPSPINWRRVVFYFTATDALMGDVRSFRNASMLIEPGSYYRQVLVIRSRINKLLEQHN